MSFRQQLLDRTKARWPDVIHLERAGSATNATDTALQILYELYRAIEDSIKDDDDWNQLGVWAFHQALWTYAIERVSSGDTAIPRDAISLAAFDVRMQDNLADESWASFRDEYLNS